MGQGLVGPSLLCWRKVDIYFKTSNQIYVLITVVIMVLIIIVIILYGGDLMSYCTVCGVNSNYDRIN